jgi:TRAP-type transport system small permease protein
MAELNPAPPPTPPGTARGPLFYIGAAGLITMMLVETAAVIGRHLGWPLLGALEIVQASILPAACVAMVVTTLLETHASVHLLTERMSPSLRAVIARVSAILAAVFFGALAAGALWLTKDFWNAHEESEVLHIPFPPLRVIVTLSMTSIALLFAWRAVRPRRKP